MRVTTKYTFDIASLRSIEHVYFDNYSGPCELACGGPSQAEQTAQQQAAAESAQLQSDFNTQFSEQQTFLNTMLIPSLTAMYTNPAGFGPAAMADLEASLVNTTGAQAANAKQNSQAAFDTNNMAGLPSGVEQAIQSQISSAAGNTVATGTNQINLANQQYKNQQQMTALSGLENIPQMFGMSPQTGGLLTRANANSFNQANQINQQGNFWGNLGQGVLGGLIGTGTNLLGNYLGGFFVPGDSGVGGAMFGLGGGGQGNANLGNPRFTGAPVTTSPIGNVIT